MENVAVKDAVKDVERDVERELITTKEACQILKLNRYTIYKLLKNKELKGYRISNKYMFDKKEVLDFLEKHRIA